MSNKKKYHGEDFNNYPLVGLPTPLPTNTTAAANVQFVLDNSGGTVESVNNVAPDENGNISLAFNNLNDKPTTIAGYGITDAYTKSQIDSKTDVIFTVVGDDFVDSTKIQANNNVIVDNGALRVRSVNYADDFSSKTFVDEDLTSTEVDIVNGVADVVSGTVGYDGTTGQIAHVLTSEPFTYLDDVTQFRVTANFNDNLGNLTGFEAGLKGLSITSDLFYQIRDVSDNALYEIYWVKANTTFIVVKDGTQYSYTKSAYTYTESDSLVRNVALAVDGTFLYAVYPSSGTDYTIVRITKATMSEANRVTMSFGGTVQKIDIAITSESGQNRLHLVATSLVTSTYFAYYNYINLDTFALGHASNQTIYSIASAAYMSIQITATLTNGVQDRLWYTIFRTTTTSAIFYGIISTTYTASTMQPLLATTNITTGGEACNGNGILLYNSTANTIYAISARTGGTGMNYQIFNNANNAVLLNNFTTTAPFNSITTRFMSGVVESASRIHLFFGTASRTVNSNYTYGVISLASNTFSIVSSISTFIATGSALPADRTAAGNFVQQSSSPFLFRVYTSSQYYNYTNNIKPTLLVSLRNQANQSISSTTQLTSSSNSATLTVSPIKTIRVRFEFIYPIFTANFSGTVYSVDLFDYAIEQLNPAPTYPEGYFKSVPLLTDRPISKVTLEVDQTIGSVGNQIQWYVFSKNGSFKEVNASNNWTAEFADNKIGSTLQVEAYINNGATPSNIQTARINGYKAYVYNVVTRTDFLALQINVMKLGLQVGTWNASQRTGFTKMMIDTFADGNGVTGMTPSGGLITGTGTATSVAENTDGNIFPAQILVVDDMNSTGGILYQVKRNSGDWELVTPNAIHTFQNGTPQTTNQVQIRASLDNATLAGWAYLYA